MGGSCRRFNTVKAPHSCLETAQVVSPQFFFFFLRGEDMILEGEDHVFMDYVMEELLCHAVSPLKKNQ